MPEQINGARINTIVAEQGLSSIRRRPGKLATLESVDRIILLGSSCVGKSTLEQAVRTASLEDPLLAGRISVPLRVVTRSPRPGDNDLYFCTPDELDRMAQGGELGLYGVKAMEGGRQEPYGYLKPEEGTFPVFFANNQTLKNREVTGPEGILQDALLIAIYAPDDVRGQRLRSRSPGLFEERPEEAAFRLSREERAIGSAKDVHLILKNYGRFATRSTQDTIRLIEEITLTRRETNL